MGRLSGVAALVGASALWGSSFPAIKLAVGEVGEYAYTWMRGLLSVALASPYLAWRAARGGLDWAALRGGLYAGVAYTLGLWLQGWGTGLTSASNSAFITALHMVWVHAYTAALTRSYTPRLAAALALALAGVFLLSRPDRRPGLGDALVLAGSFAWAAQVLVVDRFSRGDPLQFTAAQFVVSTAFIVPDVLDGGIEAPSPGALALLAYLAAGPGLGGFALQVYGQRHVDPARATLVYQLEPVFAAAISRAWLGESLGASGLAGAAMVMASVALSEVPTRASRGPGRAP